MQIASDNTDATLNSKRRLYVNIDINVALFVADLQPNSYRLCFRTKATYLS